MMTFASTRDPSITADFRQAVLAGLAPDGGLYHPTEQPDLHSLFLGLNPEGSFVDTAVTVVERLFGDTFGAHTAELVRRAFPFAPELISLTDQIDILELFHGPSCAFKDFGASFLATAMETFLAGTDERAVILTATSGDTGSAVAQAFHNRPNIEVVILYPSGRVSNLQEQQLTTVGGNVTALEVAGSFDDCQRLVKEAFVDKELRHAVPLTSANSINIGRLLPQALYYIHAFALLRARMISEFYFCVPSGNFGNLTAGVLAWSWGLPVSGFIAATNVNDVVPDYLRTGHYVPRASIQTIANAMDVGDPSNFERLLAIFDSDHAALSTLVSGVAATDEQIRATMRQVYDEKGLFIDPHTAAGIYGAQSFLASEGAGDATIVTLSTAHPAKFVEVVEEVCGARPDLPAALETALHREKHSMPIAAESAALKHYLLERHTAHG
jgi:threonine synthase